MRNRLQAATQIALKRVQRFAVRVHGIVLFFGRWLWEGECPDYYCETKDPGWFILLTYAMMLAIPVLIVLLAVAMK